MKFPKAFLNPVSFLGAVIATISFGASAVLLLLEFFRSSSRPYQGILTFFIFPAFLILGLILIPAGALWRHRRLRKGGADLPAFPILDFNKPRERSLYFAFGAVSLLILLFSALGGYQAYEFTESVTFCGQLCHTVMEPEATTHATSPHARVKCVECHVGPGAEWYFKAKVSGLEQLVSTLAGSYPRPIPSPVEHLRPARDTCEECHWPDKHFGTRPVARTSFASDGRNSRRDFLMLLKVGGGGSDREPGEGIHWHMNIKNRIEYKASDAKRTEIAWVASRSADGKLTEFTDLEKAASARDLAALEVRTMDCLDCHNRPAHIFFSPEEAVNRSLAAGLLDSRLPYLKKAAVEALSAGYASLTEAEAGIEARLKAFFAENVPPGIAAGFAPQLPAQAEELRAIYRRNFFPHMKASWAAYPDHIGHREFAGCFRCHDGRRRSPEGKVLSKDCDLCHTFAARSDDGKSMTALPSDGSFLHPWKHERHSQMDCWSCHAGAASPYETCGKCHDAEAGAPMAFACSSCHKPLKVKVENAECAPCHGVAKSKLHAIKDHGDCLACHKQHEWRTVAYPDDCTGTCHQNLKKPHHEGEPCSPCHDFKGVTSHLGF